MARTKADRNQTAARKARLDAISKGLAAEVAAFNAAIGRGVEVRLPNVGNGSLLLGQRVARARFGYDGLWIECANYGGSFAYGNDSDWADLLSRAGVERDPRAT